MIQRFAAKALAGYDVSGEMGWQELNGDTTIKARVVCQIDLGHPAFAELFQNAVIGEGLADHGGPSVGPESPGNLCKSSIVQRAGIIMPEMKRML